MKKRLRKKLCLGEFRELGFAVEVQFTPGATDAHVDEVCERLEAVSHLGPNGSGLCACGG